MSIMYSVYATISFFLQNKCSSTYVFQICVVMFFKIHYGLSYSLKSFPEMVNEKIRTLSLKMFPCIIKSKPFRYEVSIPEREPVYIPEIFVGMRCVTVVLHKWSNGVFIQ